MYQMNIISIATTIFGFYIFTLGKIQRAYSGVQIIIQNLLQDDMDSIV